MTGDTPVTAIMITGRDESRLRLARAAVAAWQRQRLTRNRRLLVINDHPTLSLFNATYAAPMYAKEHRVTDRCSLGALRNLGIELSDTAYLVQWDDDDISSPSRLLWQLEHTQAGGASILRYEIHCHAATGTAFVNDGKTIRCGGFPGTMLWPRDSGCRFPEIPKREDTEFVMQLLKKSTLRVLDNDPSLYCRFWHGANTWNESHVMNRKPGWRTLSVAEQQYVAATRKQLLDAQAT